MISIRNCTCCGREFATGVFGSRCGFCQDEGYYTKDGFIGKRHKPCRDILEIILDPQERRRRETGTARAVAGGKE